MNKKLILKKVIVFGLIFFGSIILYQYWYFSQTWTGVIPLHSEGGSYKMIGTFRDLETCMIESAKEIKDANNLLHPPYFCGRACVVDAVFGEALIEDLKCDEKHFSPNKINH